MTSRYSFAAGGIVSASNTTSGGRIISQGPNVDRFGNCWVNADSTFRVFDAAATLLQSYSTDTLVTSVCTYALANQSPGTSWTESAHSIFDSAPGVAVFTEAGVSYIVVVFTKSNTVANTWLDTCALLLPASDGTYTVAGVTWGFAFNITEVGSNFLTKIRKIDLAGQKAFADPIIVAMGLGATAEGPCFKAFPSITATLGIASAVDQTRYLWPSTWFHTGDDYNAFGQHNEGLGINAGEDQPVFFMPGASSTTKIMVYVSKAAMAVTSQPFIVASLQPTYPDGCLAKATLPTTGFALTTSFPARTDTNLSAPVAAPGCFTDGVTPYDAFTDVGLHYDGTSGAGGDAEYFAVPRLIEPTGDGFLVGWYHPWFQDPTYAGSTNWLLKERLRLQTYSAATETFTDAGMLQGATAPIDDLGGSVGGPTDFMDINGWTLAVDGPSLAIWHYDGPSSTSSARFLTWRGLIGSKVVGQVTVHTRIGASRSGSPVVPPAPPLAPVNLIAPSISGVPNVGNEVTVDVGVWTGNP